MTSYYPTPTVEQFRNGVTEFYIKNGFRPMMSELLRDNRWSENGTRKLLRDAGGTVQGISADFDFKPSYSKNYRTMESGTHRVTVYAPCLYTLREAIVALRKTLGDAQGQAARNQPSALANLQSGESDESDRSCGAIVVERALRS